MIMLSQDDSNEVKEILHLLRQHLTPKEQYVLTNIRQYDLPEVINEQLINGAKYIQHIKIEETSIAPPKYMVIFEKDKADN
jgi:hypothetical protein